MPGQELEQNPAGILQSTSIDEYHFAGTRVPTPEAVRKFRQDRTSFVLAEISGEATRWWADRKSDPKWLSDLKELSVELIRTPSFLRLFDVSQMSASYSELFREHSSDSHPFEPSRLPQNGNLAHIKTETLEDGLRALLSSSLEERGLPNRGSHCIDAAGIAAAFAQELKMNAKDATLTVLAALFHDLGHSPFGHTGEKAIRRIQADLKSTDLPANGNEAPFDHDVRGLRILERGKIQKILNRSRTLGNLGISNEDIICALADQVEDCLLANPQKDESVVEINARRVRLFEEYRHIHDLVKNHVDRLSYFRLDTKSLELGWAGHFCAEALISPYMKCARIVLDAHNNKRIAFTADAWETETQLGPLYTAITLRYEIFKMGGNHPVALVPHEALIDGIVDAVRRGPKQGGFTLEQFQRMTDSEALNCLPGHITGYLSQKMRGFSGLIAVRLSALTPEARRILDAEDEHYGSSQVDQLIRNNLQNTYALPEGTWFVCKVPNYSKMIQPHLCEDGKISSVPMILGAPANDHDRFVFVVVHESVLEEKRVLVRNQLSHLLKSAMIKTDGGEEIRLVREEKRAQLDTRLMHLECDSLGLATNNARKIWASPNQSRGSRNNGNHTSRNGVSPMPSAGNSSVDGPRVDPMEYIPALPNLNGSAFVGV